MFRQVYNPELIDAIEALDPVEYAGSVWRICPASRDPTVGRNSKGRWSDGRFSVLYTSLEADTARAEVYFHAYVKNPVPPSGLQFQEHELSVDLRRALKLLDFESLTKLGVTEATFARKDYASTVTELYPVTQSIGAVANFLGYDGVLVPSARAEGRNLVVLLENLPEKCEVICKVSKRVDLQAWARSHS